MCFCNYCYFAALHCKTGLEFYLPEMEFIVFHLCHVTKWTHIRLLSRYEQGRKVRDHSFIILQKPPLRSSEVHTAVPAHTKQFKLHLSLHKSDIQKYDYFAISHF